MATGNHLAELELTVLLTLSHLEDAATSRSVYEEIVASTGRDVAVASVHVTLNRLGDKGLVRISSAPGPKQVGREVQHFALTDAGFEALRRSRDYWQALWRGARLEAPGDNR